MYSLNLLPPEIKKEIDYSRENARLVKYLGLSLNVFLIILALFITLAISIQNEQKIAEVEKNSSERIKEQDKNIETKSEDLAKKLKLIKKLKNERTNWAQIFTTLSDKTPPRIQLDSVSISLKNNIRAKVTGLARSDRDVVLFKDLLSSSDLFAYADIENISESSDPSDRNIPTKSFMISFSLKKATK